MAITIVVEDGTVVSGANSWVYMDYALAYIETRVGKSTLLDTDESELKAALVQSTRMLSYYVSWVGGVVSESQATAWPRQGIVWDGDRYRTSASWPLDTGTYYLYASNEIPVEIKDAECEMMVSLLETDTMTANALSGLSSVDVSGVVKIVADTKTRPEIIPAHVAAMISKWGRVKSASSGTIEIGRG